MRKSIALLACLVLLLSLSGLALSANPNPKGQVIIGAIGDNETLNPLLSEANSETQLLNGVFSQLIRLNDKGDFIPDLAKEVPTLENGGISSDGLTFTFHLRDDVKFHDGHPLTAEDVKFTWETIMNPDVQVVSRDGFDKISSLETPDAYTVIMHLDKFEANFLFTWAQTAGSIVPKHILGNVAPSEINKAQDYSRNPIGSGPFKFAEWKDGQYTMLVANKEYFGEGPYLDRVIQKVVPDSNTLLTQIRTGEVDIAQLQPGQYELAKAIPHIRVDLNPAATYQQITLNLDRPWFKDKKVRQALSYATPRDLIKNAVLKGVGVPAAGSTSPVLWAYDESLEPHEFDLGKANQLLDEAGWVKGADGIREKDGTKLSFTICTNAGNITREQIEQVLQQEWKKIGVDLNIRNYEWATFIGDILDNRKFDAALFAWVTGADPDETTLYHSNQIPTEANGKEGQNYMGYVNPEMDKLLDAGKLTFDREERTRIYRQVQRIYYEDVPMIYLYYYVNVDVYPADLQNYKPAPFTNTISWNMAEWKR